MRGDKSLVFISKQYEAVTVPLLDLRRQYELIRNEIDPVIRRVVESQYFILGPEVDAFEQEVAAYCQTPHSIGVSSGTDAILIALMAEAIGDGAEVITTPFSFFATAGSIVRANATPVFADIDPLTFNIDPTKIEERITKNTRAIMPVHLYGQCAEMDSLLVVARAKKLVMIEDAAQAIGADYKGKRAGSFGEHGCFSFFPSKNLGAFGDGGLVTCSDANRYERLKMLRVHGGRTKYFHDIVGGNFRIDALQAAILRVKLKYLDTWTEGRQKNAARYKQLFTDANVVSPDPIRPEPGKLCLPFEAPARRHIYNQFVIRVPRRDQVLAYLREKQIGAEVYYPLPLHLQQCFKGLGYGVGDFPESERAAQETLALPIFPELTPNEMEEVVARVREALSQR